MFLCDEEMNGNKRNLIVAYQKDVTYFYNKDCITIIDA